MTDIREDPDVIKVFWEMMGKDPYQHNPEYMVANCYKCGMSSSNRMGEPIEFSNMPACPIPDPITMSIGDLAFFMRNKCDNGKYLDALCEIIFNGISEATPEEMIRAAVAAWSAK